MSAPRSSSSWWRAFWIGALLAAAPGYTLACSCMGTSSIGEALSDSDDVIVGRVLSLKPATYLDGASTPEGVEIEVLKTLKGSLTGSVFVATMSMCYRTFDAGHFKPGETYVLPLDPPWNSGESADAISMLPNRGTEPRGRWFELPGCSHSGLALIGGQLYTNRGHVSQGIDLDYYMSLWMLELLLPLGVLRPIPTIVLVVLAAVTPIAFLWYRRSRRTSLAEK